MALTTACPPAVSEPTPKQISAGQRDARDGRNSCLYGTGHVAQFAWRFPGPRITQALKESQVVALERGLDDLESGKTRRQLKRIANIWADGAPSVGG